MHVLSHIKMIQPLLPFRLFTLTMEKQENNRLVVGVRILEVGG